MNIRARALVAVALLSLLALPAAHADVRRADPTPEAADAALGRALQARLDEAYGPIWASRDPQRFVDAILADDVVLTGSDTTHAWRGRAQAIELITELMKVAPTVKARALHTRRLGPDVAYQFVVFDLQGKDPAGKDTTLTAKSLYVWTRGRDGWRIAADHYSLVGMDALQ
jgi:uncharacterized protein (TIGR02246 family)